jgi:thiol-disulfide isomerase/thioredoxin
MAANGRAPADRLKAHPQTSRSVNECHFCLFFCISRFSLIGREFTYTMIKILPAFIFLISAFIFASAQGSHEYAPLQEKELAYKNWNYPSVSDGKEINLREFAKNKKLVLVVYLAPWCPNWKNEQPFVESLYEKYNGNGLAVIGVSEYGSIGDSKAAAEAQGIKFPIVYESVLRDDREKTTHYAYRQTTGDTRKWGSPWNIFITPGLMEKKGDTLLKKAHIVNGELIADETEKFIRKNLGLPAEDKKARTSATNKTNEACDPTSSTLKKP